MSKNIRKGNVKDVYEVGKNLQVIVASNRVAIENIVIPNYIPHKGEVTTKLSSFFLRMTEGIVPNVLVSEKVSDMPEEFQNDYFKNRSILVKKANVLPEIVVRGYLSGTAWEQYKKHGVVAGVQLPKNLRESQKLPTPILTANVKNGIQNATISFEELVARIGSISYEIQKKSMELYTFCSEYARKKGIIIADTKFKFGVDNEGQLLLMSDLITPDSSRLWSSESQQKRSYDKQCLRQCLRQLGWDEKSPAPILPSEVVDKVSQRYIEVCKILIE